MILLLAFVGGFGWFLSRGPSAGDLSPATDTENLEAGVPAANPLGVEGADPSAEGLTSEGSPRLAADVAGADIETTQSPEPVQEITPGAPSDVVAAGPQSAPAATEAAPQPRVEVVGPAIGRLEINVLPWAHVFINGESRGEFQNRLELDMPAGVHQIRLMNPNFQTFDTTVVVEGGATTAVARAMQSGGGP